MKLLSLVTLFMLVAMTSRGQEKDPLSVQKAVYKEAQKYRDFEVAKSALYQIIALSEEKEAEAYRDTLAQFYFELGAYTECILLTNEILKKSPSKYDILFLKAASEQTVGLNKNALEDYEKLYAAKPEVLYLYQIASLQYGMLRLGECRSSIEKIMLDPRAKTEKVSIITGKSQQSVSILAATLNMKGVLFKDLKQYEDAIAMFEKSLGEAPKFVLALGNLVATKQLVAAEKEKYQSESTDDSNALKEEDGKKKRKKR